MYGVVIFITCLQSLRLTPPLRAAVICATKPTTKLRILKKYCIRIFQIHGTRPNWRDLCSWGLPNFECHVCSEFFLLFRKPAYFTTGSERRRQPKRLQTCYEYHNTPRIRCAYFWYAGFCHVLYGTPVLGLEASGTPHLRFCPKSSPPIKRLQWKCPRRQRNENIINTKKQKIKPHETNTPLWVVKTKGCQYSFSWRKAIIRKLE